MSEEANSRLLASAPELLEALKGVDKWHDLIKQNYPEMLKEFSAARAAIAKATMASVSLNDQPPNEIFREQSNHT